MSRTLAEYEDLVQLLILGNHDMLDDGINQPHSLVLVIDGDGWNEPYSEDYSCFCENWEGIGWMQIDRECSDRPSLTDMAFKWRDHIYRDVYKTEDGCDDVFDNFEFDDWIAE